jgi:putative nucleotidyltransferase with HDIG domain/PAS domain S-box-containing protein
MKTKNSTPEQLKKEIERLRRRIAELETLETEHMQAAEALRINERFLASIFNSIQDGISILDKGMNIVRVNPVMEKWYEHNMPLVGKKCYSAYHDRDERCETCPTWQTLQTGESAYEVVPKRGPAGKIVGWLDLYSFPMVDAATGEMRGVIEYVRNITDRKHAEEELERSYQQLRETFIETVNALASTVEMKDPYTAGHQRWATRLACAIAKEMGLSEEQIEGIRMAASIHDIGKINIPAEILSKPGQLSEIQYNMVKIHAQVGCDILREIKFPWPVAEIVLQHHERWDGSGYPERLSGEEIILEARILAVADTVEAMSSHRPYRVAHGIDSALEEISQNRGTLYDPAVVDACLTLFEKGFRFD